MVDGFGRFMKVLTFGAAAVALLLSFDYLRQAKTLKFEYPVLALLATAGMGMMISANDLIALYLGLELQSLALYVMAAIRRDDLRSSEAGLKYFVLGALSSGMLLYGASLIYGFTGSTSFASIAAAAAQPGAGQNIGLIIGLVFLLVGIAFKVSAVPFHMWTPDVYEGAPTPVTAFFASAPKVAAMALFMRVALESFAGIKPQWQQVVTALAIASMVLGAFAAIGQTNIKRLLAYSAIGNIGYALIGLAAGSPEGARGVIIYLVIYVAMTLGAFACVLAMRRPDGMVEDIDELSGLGAEQPRHGHGARDPDVLAGRHSAAGRLLRQVLRVRGGREGRAVGACHHRRACQRGRCLLLRADRQDHVLRRAAGEVREHPAEGRARDGGDGALHPALRRLARAAGRGGGHGGQEPVLNPTVGRRKESLCRRPFAVSSWMRSAPPTARRFSAPTREKWARCGSWPGARRPGAAARGGSGLRSLAISTPACW